MTQAFNLAQLANNLNTSGQLDATDGLTGLVTNANLASSGTASSSTFLRGDRTWATVVQTVLQIQSTYTGNLITGSPDTWTDVLSLSITPASTSSKILILARTSVASNSGNETSGRILRNGTEVGGYNTASGGAVNFYGHSMGGDAGGTGWGSHSHPFAYVDSPSTTSAVTYKIQMVNDNADLYVNRTSGTTGGDSAGAASTLILIEFA